MNVKRYLVASFALFAFIFIYEWLIHGVILMHTYQETPQVWRSFDEMIADMPFAILEQLLLAFWSAFAFTQIFKNGGIKNGLLFGLYFGVFAGILTASWYLWLPVAPILGWSWLLIGISEGIVGGLILGSLYKN